MAKDLIKIEFGDLEALEGALKDSESTIFVAEPIQCEGGMNMPPENYFRRARELCDKHQVIMVLDEVQTGLGRTGAMLAQEHYMDKDNFADITALAKSLSGGQEVASAIIAKPEYADMIKPSEYGSTFGGSPKAAMTVRAAIRELEDRNLCAEAAVKGEYLLKQLKLVCQDIPGIIEVRGKGMAIGIEVEGHGADDICNRLRESSFVYRGQEINGCWTNSTHGITDETTVIRLSPPLTISGEIMKASLFAIAKAINHPHANQFRCFDLEGAKSSKECLIEMAEKGKYLSRRAGRFLLDLHKVRSSK